MRIVIMECLPFAVNKAQPFTKFISYLLSHLFEVDIMFFFFSVDVS